MSALPLVYAAGFSWANILRFRRIWQSKKLVSIAPWWTWKAHKRRWTRNKNNWTKYRLVFRH